MVPVFLPLGLSSALSPQAGELNPSISQIADVIGFLFPPHVQLFFPKLLNPFQIIKKIAFVPFGAYIYTRIAGFGR